MTGDWPASFEALLREHLPLLPATTELARDASLVDLGLDSLTTVALLVGLEDLFEVSVPDDLLVAETFATPAALWQVVDELSRKRAADIS